MVVRWGILGTGGIARHFAADLRSPTPASSPRSGRGRRERGPLRRRVRRRQPARQLRGPRRRPGRRRRLRRHAAPDAPRQRPPGARGGKPVLVEKPFTMNADEARDLVGAGAGRGLFLMEAMWTRFLPHVGRDPRLAAASATSSRSPPTTASGSPKTRSSGCSRPNSVAARCSTWGCTRSRSRRWCSARPPGSSSHERPGVHRRRRADVDAVRLRERRPGRADLHAARPRARHGPRSSAPTRGSRSRATSTPRPP